MQNQPIRLVSMKRHIPNILTLLNAFCGITAIYFAIKDYFIISSILIFIAVLLDFLDGFFARMFKATSALGQQLDSLADLISFGMAPALLIFMLMEDSFLVRIFALPVNLFFLPPSFMILATLFRLARFNISDNSTHFTGMPSPANGMLLASIPMIIFVQLEDDNTIHELIIQILQNAYFLGVLLIIQSLLLISGIRGMHLKFSNFSWKDNKSRYILLIISLIFFGFFQFISVPIIIYLYLFISLFNNSTHEVQS